nr:MULTISPECIES: DUF2726 domain-containing protein [unclassified Modicisalibacter]
MVVLALMVITLGLWAVRYLVPARRRLPYVGREALNSPTEQAFMAAVSRAVGSRVMIANKVRIADVLDVSFRRRHSRDQRWWRHFRAISSKHVDLVLCEPNGGRILAALELDDRSHRRGDRRRRDRFVDRAFASAGVPLLRFAARRRYDVAAIHSRLVPHLPGALATPTQGSTACQNSRSTTP